MKGTSADYSNFVLCHIARMFLAVKENEASNVVDVSLDVAAVRARR